MFQVPEAGICQQQFTGHRREEILAADLQKQGEILLEEMLELVVEAGAMSHNTSDLRGNPFFRGIRGILGERESRIAL